MIDVKSLFIRPISSTSARSFVKKHHYSGKVVNSWLHLGVFHNGILGGVMQFGTPINKRESIKLVKDTEWQGMVELNRMAFLDWLPKNSESRAISIASRIIKKEYPKIEWILSFADGCQCGDGTIYRAAGMLLLRIQKNKTIVRLKTGVIAARLRVKQRMRSGATKLDFSDSSLLEGYQLMYILPLNRTVLERLQLEVLPYSDIDKLGAKMYKGKKCVQSIDGDTSNNQLEEGGSTPTCTLGVNKTKKAVCNG